MHAGIGVQYLPQFSDAVAGQAKADGVGVSTETGEKSAAIFRLQRIQQMKRRNRAAGALGLAGLRVARDDERWPAVALDDARGHNANHAAMPAVAIEHQAIGGADFRVSIEPLLDLAHDARLFLLAVSVELVKLGGKLASAELILYRK